MSGYWDAMGRVAHGLPGSAEPRQRSMFEVEPSFGPPGELEAIEDEVSMLPVAAPVSHMQEQPTPAPTTATAIAASQPERAGSTRDPSLPIARPSPEVEQPATELSRSAEPDRPAGARKPTAPVQAQQLAKRVEVHRIETRQTTPELVEVRAVASASGGETAPGVQATPTASPGQMTAEQAKPTDPLPVIVIPPRILVAEPMAMPPPDRQAPAPEPPLLIEIGRIDIRIESQAPTPPVGPRRRDTQPVQSLDDFLRRRGAGS